MIATDKSILGIIKNPSINRTYTIKHIIPELTFEGGDKKPDFGEIIIEYIPNEKLIELKSLKYYFYQFRNKMYSYERIINVIYDDVSQIYQPRYLRIELKTNPRGGISSHLKVSSDYI